MSERFDILFAGLSEDKAMELLVTDTEKLDNPGLKYTAATRLGASQSSESLSVLIEVSDQSTKTLYDRITRRKAIEALGRRKEASALPVLVRALACEDEPTIVNAADAITRIGVDLTEQDQRHLLAALAGPDNQKRAIIQSFTRLNLDNPGGEISGYEKDENPLISGAALAYASRVQGKENCLKPLIEQLNDINVGRRRAAVIDLGDAGDPRSLQYIIKSPVSMPLRAKIAFNLVSSAPPQSSHDLLEQLLRDDPRSLEYNSELSIPTTPEGLEASLKNTDEAKQYLAAKALLSLDRSTILSTIDDLHTRLGSDYGIHYLITSCVGLLRLDERIDIIEDSLSETAPQFAKSRIAAAWACLSLKLTNQKDKLEDLAITAQWTPLRWSCQQVLKKL